MAVLCDCSRLARHLIRSGLIKCCPACPMFPAQDLSTRAQEQLHAARHQRQFCGGIMLDPGLVCRESYVVSKARIDAACRFRELTAARSRSGQGAAQQYSGRMRSDCGQHEQPGVMLNQRPGAPQASEHVKPVSCQYKHALGQTHAHTDRHNTISLYTNPCNHNNAGFTPEACVYTSAYNDTYSHVQTWETWHVDAVVGCIPHNAPSAPATDMMPFPGRGKWRTVTSGRFQDC